jgi:hypothetical protein
MDVIELAPYKRLTNEELIEEIYSEIVKLKTISENDDEQQYLKEAMIFNAMIIETKRRNLKIDKTKLIDEILKW